MRNQSKTERNQAIALAVQAGERMAELARRYGISRARVGQLVARAGLTSQHGHTARRVAMARLLERCRADEACRGLPVRATRSLAAHPDYNKTMELLRQRRVEARRQQARQTHLGRLAVLRREMQRTPTCREYVARYGAWPQTLFHRWRDFVAQAPISDQCKA